MFAPIIALQRDDESLLAHPMMAEGLNALFSQLPPSSAH